MPCHFIGVAVLVLRAELNPKDLGQQVFSEGLTACSAPLA